MKYDLNKLSKEKLIIKVKFLRKMFWILFFMTLLISSCGFYWEISYFKQKQLTTEALDLTERVLNITEEYKEMLLFSLEINQYCAYKNNITYDKFMEEYLEHEMNIILGDFKND